MALLAWQDATSRDELVEESLTADVRLSQVHEQDDAARSKALVANVLLGTGALAVGIGALLLATADDDPAATAVGLAPARGGWALVVGGTL